MTEKHEEYLAHAYEADPYPILKAGPSDPEVAFFRGSGKGDYWGELSRFIEMRARQAGGDGYGPLPEERGR